MMILATMIWCCVCASHDVRLTTCSQWTIWHGPRPCQVQMHRRKHDVQNSERGAAGHRHRHRHRHRWRRWQKQHIIITQGTSQQYIQRDEKNKSAPLKDITPKKIVFVCCHGSHKSSKDITSLLFDVSNITWRFSAFKAHMFVKLVFKNNISKIW